MAYNEELARGIAAIVGVRDDVAEKKMFGGVAYMIQNKMACGIVRDDLMARIGPEEHDAALAEPNVRPMDFAGRPMKGMIYVSPEGWRDPAILAKWVNMSVAFVLTLPADKKAMKSAKPAPKAPKPAAKAAPKAPKPAAKAAPKAAKPAAKAAPKAKKAKAPEPKRASKKG